MLGKLAKWLRIMGYDAYYQSCFKGGARSGPVTAGGRLLLTRNRAEIALISNSFLISSNQVKDQLRELQDAALIASDRSQWFTRCILCNTVLNQAETEVARERVPDYVYSQNMSSIQNCPSCQRYFWPGSHKEKMIRQLKEWGL